MGTCILKNKYYNVLFDDLKTYEIERVTLTNLKTHSFFIIWFWFETNLKLSFNIYVICYKIFKNRILVMLNKYQF